MCREIIYETEREKHNRYILQMQFPPSKRKNAKRKMNENLPFVNVTKSANVVSHSYLEI